MHADLIIALLLFISSSVQVSCFRLFKPKFCKSLESYESTIDLNYTASINVRTRHGAYDVPLNILCKLREDQSICYAYIEHDIILQNRMFVPGHIKKPMDLDDLRYQILQSKLSGMIVGYVMFGKPLTELDYLFVGLLMTDIVDKRIHGVGTSLMAVVFDVTDKCRYAGVKLFPSISSAGFYDKLGMQLTEDNRFWGYRQLARPLRKKTNLVLVNAR